MEEMKSSKRRRNMMMGRLHHHHHHRQEEGFARLMTSYRGHKGGVNCLCFRPLMKHLVSGGSDGSVLLWSLFCRPGLARQTQSRPYRFLGHQGEVCAVAVSPLDTVVASASKDKTVRLWIPTAEGRSSIIRAHSSTVRTVAFSPNGECLLTGSDDKSIKIWDVETERFIVGLNGHMNWVRSAEFNSNGRLVVSGGDDKTVRIWDVERHECIHTFNDVPGMVTCTRFHPNGTCIGTCGVNQAVQIWDIRSKMLIQHYAENAGTLRSICFHPSGNFLLSTCDDATLKVWDLREGQILYMIKGHEGATTCAMFSPTGDHFASGSQDEQVMLWQSNLKQYQRGRDFSCFIPERTHQKKPSPSIEKKMPSPNTENFSSNMEKKFMSTASGDFPKETTSSQLCGGIKKPKAAKEETKFRSYLPRSTSEYPNIQETPNCKDINQTSEEDAKHTCKKHYISDASTTIQSHKTEAATRPAILHRSVSASDVNVSSTSEDEALLGVTLNHLVSQIDTLTKSMALFGDRLSHIEDKVLDMEKA